MAWDEDFSVKFQSKKICYLEPEVITDFAKVKLMSIETKNFIWINPLCLAAICPGFADLEFHEDDDLKILTEHSLDELEHIVKFCHNGNFPVQPIPEVFHDFGIDVISYMNPVKQECPEVKYEVNDSSYDDINDTYDDFNDTKPLSKFKKKRGKAKGKYYLSM